MSHSETTQAPARSTLQKTALFALVLVAVFSLPYLVTPQPAISRSYVAGFSNRAAVLLLFLGTVLIGWFTRGKIAATNDEFDGRLPKWTLPASLLITLAMCLRHSRLGLRVPGGEAFFFLNRHQLLNAGIHPFTQFEFPYGPLLLYPIFWVQHVLHTTAAHSYIITWMLECLIGVPMVWLVVRALDFPVPSRQTLFWLVLLLQVPALGAGGLNYTPFRGYAAAFAIVAAYTVWRRTQTPWKFVLGTVAAVIFGIVVSLDQALAIAFGLNAYMVLLALFSRSKFPVSALVASLAATAACFAAEAPFGMLRTVKTFGSGGYSYPLLPTPTIILALSAYIIAGCVLIRALYLRRIDTVAAPLVLGGSAILPYALGRCDILHISGAAPAFVVGVASILTMPLVRRWWIPGAFAGLVVLPFLMAYQEKIMDRLHPESGRSSSSQVAPAAVSDEQYYVSSANLSSDSLPCDQQYFSPAFMPVPLVPFRPRCVDTGYFLGFTDVLSPTTIQVKIDELRQHGLQPLLLENIALERQFPPQMTSMQALKFAEQSFWAPPQRNDPLSYAPIIAYIRASYTPGPLMSSNLLRIWYPKSGAAAPKR